MSDCAGMLKSVAC